jgi:hypothetical protein
VPHLKENMEAMSNKKFKLFIGQAFYECKSFSPQIPCLVDAFRVMAELELDYYYEQVNGDSYVDRAKNALVHQFLKSDCTHLMIIDSDETWNVEGFARLIRAAMSGFEVVAGLYPCKNNWEFFGGFPKADENGFLLGKEINDMRLLEMVIAPGGFIIYSREAFERTRPNLDSYIAPENNESILEVFRCNIEIKDFARKTVEELQLMSKEELINHIKLCQRGGRSGGRIGEDVYFQARYKEMGGKIWCEPNIDMGHIGIKEWKGNYNNHLLECRGMTDTGEPVCE